MELKATIEFNMDNGEKLLVLIAHSLEDQNTLYTELLINVNAFKENLTLEQAGIEYITAGYWDNDNVIVWQRPFIDLNSPLLFS